MYNLKRDGKAVSLFLFVINNPWLCIRLGYTLLVEFKMWMIEYLRACLYNKLKTFLEFKEISTYVYVPYYF